MAAKVKVINKARKEQVCGRCREKIPPGQSYRFWEFRYAGKKVRCMRRECNPRQSELTSNAFLQQLYGIQENIEDAVVALKNEGDLDDFKTALEDAASEMRDLGEECASSLSNMPEGLQQGETGEKLQQRADDCEEKAGEIDSAVQEVEALEWPDADKWEEFATEENVARLADDDDASYKDRVLVVMDMRKDGVREEAADSAEALDLDIE